VGWWGSVRKADAIETGDTAMLEPQSYKDVRILTLKDYLG
jgi:predicted nucleic acid-binding protein